MRRVGPIKVLCEKCNVCLRKSIFFIVAIDNQVGDEPMRNTCMHASVFVRARL